MKTKPFDLDECMTKYGGHCVTNEGEAVEIVKTDLNGADSEYPVLVVITDENGNQNTETYATSGLRVKSDAYTDPQSLRLPVATEELFLVIVRGPGGDIVETFSKICTTEDGAETARSQRAESLEPGFTVSVQPVEVDR